MDLSEFLLARIAEDEAVARTAQFNNGRWHRTGQFAMATSVAREFGPDAVPKRTGSLAWDDNGHIARWDPARVLAECTAKRRIVEHYEGGQQVDSGTYAAKFLALPYADHPDYDPGWKV